MIGGIIAASASVVALASPVVTARAETKFLPIPQTSVPETTSCGNFSPERLQIAREILICNQESGAKNWKQAAVSRTTHQTWNTRTARDSRESLDEKICDNT